MKANLRITSIVLAGLCVMIHTSLIAHAGHGSDDPTRAVHYFSTTPHLLPWIALIAVGASILATVRFKSRSLKQSRDVGFR
jgi:hypothetical protein